MRLISSFLLVLSLLTAMPVSAATQINHPCMQTAVEKYHNALIAAFDGYVSIHKSAMTARRDSLKTAWGITDRNQRKQAIRSAEKLFKDSERVAKNVQKTSERAAKQTFENESDQCGA